MPVFAGGFHADSFPCLPLTRESVQSAYELIQANVHRTPVLTCQTLDRIASTPQAPNAASPNIRLFFKCENYQKIGAFKARGAFHALIRLIQHLGEDEVRRRGSRLCAKTYNIPAHIVMPSISTPSKIAGTKSHGARREAVVAEVIEKTGAILVPPYDHPDIILGQGTVGLELEAQIRELQRPPLDAVITPLGGGGLLSGVTTYFSPTSTRVFGAEPSFQGADDGRRGLEAGRRVESVKTLTIADGLRTPVGLIPWSNHFRQGQASGIIQCVGGRDKGCDETCLGAHEGLHRAFFRGSPCRCTFQRRLSKACREGRCGGNTTVEAIAKLFGA
ncbi:tryptophan synthase beta subunit-like PLP-dependent enzyme [Hymenopellis radicata]|nr:tryptophan synthase beta subunit-like PLP-dependent enzyme [Hymenopellis radicata]